MSQTDVILSSVRLTAHDPSPGSQKPEHVVRSNGNLTLSAIRFDIPTTGCSTHEVKGTAIREGSEDRELKSV